MWVCNPPQPELRRPPHARAHCTPCCARCTLRRHTFTNRCRCCTACCFSLFTFVRDVSSRLLAMWAVCGVMFVAFIYLSRVFVDSCVNRLQSWLLFSLFLVPTLALPNAAVTSNALLSTAGAFDDVTHACS